MQSEVFQDHNKREKKGGPENRINDLSYTEWMKFQKSFFWISDDQTEFEKSVRFFTKEVWPDDRISDILVLGLDGVNPNLLGDRRLVDYHEKFGDLTELIEHVKLIVQGCKKFDFIIIDLRKLLNSTSNFDNRELHEIEDLFICMQVLLREGKYAQIIVNHNSPNGSGFPIAWMIAQLSRKWLRLRDEKIGLEKETQRIEYFLFFQMNEDISFKRIIKPESIHFKGNIQFIPNFVFPKPPPRKKHEILHPAKFPETLVSDFIELFSRPNDTVFDPMVGTGSTIIAANRVGRNAIGVELSPDFANIARRRIQDEKNPSLFEEFASKVKGEVYVGDATDIHSITELKNRTFEYVITSPPYWSMLNNPGSENQRNRKQKGLKLAYSTNERDLGNVNDYDSFLDLLNIVYRSIAHLLTVGGKMTIIVKNVKRDHILYPLAWDIVEMLSSDQGDYNYLGNTFWCQDDVPLKPFAVGTHWVSNILHQYCLHFEKR